MAAMAEVCNPGGLLMLSGIHGKKEAAQVRRAARKAGLKALPKKGKTLRQWQLVILQKPA
jgi:ribosomal protein L11 methylase PrmA